MCHKCILLLFLQIFETSSLAFVITNGGTVLLNAPLGSSNFSSEVFGKGFKYYNIDINFFYLDDYTWRLVWNFNPE